MRLQRWERNWLSTTHRKGEFVSYSEHWSCRDLSLLFFRERHVWKQLLDARNKSFLHFDYIYQPTTKFTSRSFIQLSTNSDHNQLRISQPNTNTMDYICQDCWREFENSWEFDNHFMYSTCCITNDWNHQTIKHQPDNNEHDCTKWDRKEEAIKIVVERNQMMNNGTEMLPPIIN